MLGFFKKKMKKDPYLERVASILHQTIGPTLPLENAYNLAEECLHELRDNISKGMFQDGVNPRENIMAYYSLCNMVSESSASDNKMEVLKISVMAQLLKEKLGEFESMSSLEKGIWQFGEQALSEGAGTYTKDDIEKIKSDTVQIIMNLMREQEVTASQQDVTKIVENVSSNIGDKEVSIVGEKVLSVSVLSNATGYYIDQEKNDLAHSYFMCIGEAIRMYFEGQMDSYSDHQSNALSMIMQDHRSLGEELMSNSNEPFDNITKETIISTDDIGNLLQSDTSNIAKIHSGAKSGNLTCQIFLSQMELVGLTKYADDPSINHEKIAQMQKNFEYYTKLAAEQDDADSQFNLAKNYLMKVDISKGTLNEGDITNLESAKHWYEKANSNGHDDTEEIISTLNELLSNSSSDGEGLTDWFENNHIRAKYKPQSIEKWSDLEELDLRTNDLSELPDCISVLTGLVDLSLFHNNFSIVPEVIFILTELSWLNLGVNQISELPRGIGRLKKLKILDLGQNQLVSLPSEIGELTNLEQLIVHNSNLTSLPKEIGNMTALKHISIWDNNLSSLPDEIMNLNNLETIEIQNNNFTDENAKKWTDRFSNTKCKISFGYQQGNISEPIYVETNIKGGIPEDSFLEMYLNSKDGDMVSNIFHWSSSASDEDDLFSTMMANSRYSTISANEGLNAIDSESNIVPVNIELNAETPSTEDELIQWVKLTYIQTCNEHNLKPNSKLSLVSVGSSGNKKTLKMMEL